jgi:hypothetical protein
MFRIWYTMFRLGQRGFQIEHHDKSRIDIAGVRLMMPYLEHHVRSLPHDTTSLAPWEACSIKTYKHTWKMCIYWFLRMCNKANIYYIHPWLEISNFFTFLKPKFRAIIEYSRHYQSFPPSSIRPSALRNASRSWYTFCACMYVCIYVCICVCVCVCERTNHAVVWPWHSFTYVHAYMHTCIHACINTYLHGLKLRGSESKIVPNYMHAYIHTCVH